MKPIDYLRAMVKRDRNPVDEMPTGIITYDGPLTEAEADEVRAAFEQVVPQMEQMADTMLSAVGKQLPLRCPCVAIYSSCRCDKK